MAMIDWGGTDEAMIQAMARYEEAVQRAVLAVAQYWQPIIEDFAKENAPWTDRTANARGGLHSYIIELANDTVELWLSHGVYYGIFLETKASGGYAVIAPTLEAHYEPIARMLQRIFG